MICVSVGRPPRPPPSPAPSPPAHRSSSRGRGAPGGCSCSSSRRSSGGALFRSRAGGRSGGGGIAGAPLPPLRLSQPPALQDARAEDARTCAVRRTCRRRRRAAAARHLTTAGNGRAVGHRHVDGRRRLEVVGKEWRHQGRAPQRRRRLRCLGCSYRSLSRVGGGRRVRRGADPAEGPARLSRTSTRMRETQVYKARKDLRPSPAQLWPDAACIWYQTSPSMQRGTFSSTFSLLLLIAKS